MAPVAPGLGGPGQRFFGDNSSRRQAVPLTPWDARLRAPGGPGTAVRTGGGDHAALLSAPQDSPPTPYQGPPPSEAQPGVGKGVSREQTPSPHSLGELGGFGHAGRPRWLLVVLLLPVPGSGRWSPVFPVRPGARVEEGDGLVG